MLSDILSDFDILWTIKERTDSSIVETIHMSRVHSSLKCHWMLLTKPPPYKWII